MAQGFLVTAFLFILESTFLEPSLGDNMHDFYYRIQIWARSHIPNEVHIFGPKGTGKSTFYSQLCHRQDDPPTVTETAHIEYYKCHDKRRKIEFNLADTSGDDKYRVEWFKLLQQTPPLGIIFVVVGTILDLIITAPFFTGYGPYYSNILLWFGFLEVIIVSWIVQIFSR